MLSDKETYLILESGKFFNENDSTSARNAIIEMRKAIRQNVQVLGGISTHFNNHIEWRLFGVALTK